MTETKTSNGFVAALPGGMLILAVAIICFAGAPVLNSIHFFNKYLPLADFILAILLGIFIKNTIGVPDIFQPGLKYSTILYKTGIVIMGTKYSLASLAATGSKAVILIMVFLFTSTLVIWFVARRFNIPATLAALLAAGMSVCGVSVTVALAPAIKAKNEEIAYTVSVVLMFGLLSLLVFPAIGQYFELTAEEFGAFAGIGIVNSAQVIAAGLAYSPEAGAVAGIYNIGRVLFLPVIVLMMTLLVINNEGGDTSQVNRWEMIKEKFPFFVLAFLVVVGVNTAGFIDEPTVKVSHYFMEWCFLLGFASIGLTTSLDDLKSAGATGVILGMSIATIKAALALFAAMMFL